MLWSRTLIPTLRQTPAEAVVDSHRLMLRAGIIQQVCAGSYSYLPLGWRVLQKVLQIIRQEMDGAGAVETFLPTLQPVELWETTGRRADYGENLFVVKDRHGREMALGPTHEEVMTTLVKNSITSYRQLPLTLYQIQTKFRDEFRPRFGVLRSREFQMKDGYSFDMDAAGLDKSYQAMFDAYCRIFDRCGLKYVTVEAESGPIGGPASHEFVVPCPTGEDMVLTSDKDNYAANVEKCGIGKRPHSLDGPATGALDKVHTPGCATIEDVCKFMKVKPKHMLKSLVAIVSGASVAENLLVVVRGDHEVNEGKLRSIVGGLYGQPVTVKFFEPKDFARNPDFKVGFIGPGLVEKAQNLRIIIDPDAAQEQFWATGANEVDHHVKHFNWKRDVMDVLGDAGKSRVIVAEVRNAMEGDPSPKDDGGTLHLSKGIEIGHVFKLGTKYSGALGLEVLDDSQQRRPVIMGCYGIGANRILASAIECPQGHDDKGIIWPMAIAPYQVLITPIQYEGQAREVADDLYRRLGEAGLDVLLDDRSERAGVKFNDADLIGIPLRLTIGEKGLKEGIVEFKPRSAPEAERVALDKIADRVLAYVRG